MAQHRSDKDADNSPGHELCRLLQGPEDAVAFGRALGRAWSQACANASAMGTPPPPRVLLLFGPMGAGKTTCVRGVTSGLPGGDKAEPASPSFTIANRYPTTPPLLHVDLYRGEGLPIDDDVLEALEHPEGLAVVEWSELLPEADRPPARLELTLALPDDNEPDAPESDPFTRRARLTVAPTDHPGGRAVLHALAGAVRR